MAKRIVLWLNAFVAAVYFTGHLFDFLVLVPNWRAGDVEVITRYRAFFVHTDPGAFFRFVVPATILLAIVSFLSYWKADKKLRLMLGAYLVLTLGAFLFTMFHFLPINGYLFWDKTIVLEPAKTMELAHSWASGEQLRVAFGFVAMVVAGRALHLSYSKPGH
ncbi:MAG: DUF1772 domain-containing protein [Flavobacteriales bacterium]|nr:DUF1772 domain-containing protein [Flavobacteriales bacterium]